MNAERTAGMNDIPAVQLTNITKKYGAIAACDRVDLTLRRGRIHGILGENGAGKSTLMKVLIGLVLPDQGSIEVQGTPCQIDDPQHAAALGIGMVHQHFSLVDPLTVWENVMLGDTGKFDVAGARQRVGEISERYGLGVDPDARVGNLPAGVRQRVEIIKCLRRDPSILIFDEPTSVLTPAESEGLFDVLRQAVQDEGRAVALVSHKLDEVLRATDEITIMRRGQVVERMTTSEADAPTLARAMVGRDVSLRSEASALGVVGEAVASAAGDKSAPTTDPHRHETPVLELRRITTRGGDGRLALNELDLEVHAGEIVGVAGVEGNGQTALTDLLSSLSAAEAGQVIVTGTAVPVGKPGAMADAGIAVIPEDRHDSGCVLEMSVAENLFLVAVDRLASGGVYDPAAMRAEAVELIDEFEVQCAGPDAPFWSLSGGNQQRVVLARELGNSPKVLVAAQPTRGLDVGAIEWMTQRLQEAADGGVGVLLISSELEEILQLSDRIVVLFEGRVAGEMLRGQVDLEQLGLLMGGSTIGAVGSP